MLLEAYNLEFLDSYGVKLELGDIVAVPIMKENGEYYVTSGVIEHMFTYSEGTLQVNCGDTINIKSCCVMFLA